MADRVVTARDGRALGLTSMGDPAVARIVVFCHPAPGAGGFDPDPRVTSSWGVHVVSIDRPGYGVSAPLPDAVRPTVGLFADDIAAYVRTVRDSLHEVNRSTPPHIGVVGWSAGGRVALALAARHPGLVDRVAVVATPAPDTAVRWIPERFAAMNRELVALPPAEARTRLRAALQSQVPQGAPTVDLLGAAEPDETILDGPGVRDRALRMLAAAYRQGAAGVAADILSYADDDWGFDLGTVQAQTLLVYGAKDRVVPSAHGRWYRRRLVHARLTVVPRAGHLVVVPAWERILAHVAPHPSAA